jgi:hypothetical protein
VVTSNGLGPVYPGGPPWLDPETWHLIFSQPGSRLVDSPYYLYPEPTMITICRHGLRVPVARLVDLADWGWRARSTEGKQPLSDADRFHLIPRANLVVIVAPGSDRLLLAPINLAQAEDALGDELGTDLLFVTSTPPVTFCPNTEFRYQLRVRSRAGGVTFNLIEGPPGMAVGPDGLLQWKVPAVSAPVRLRIPVIGLHSAKTLLARLPGDLVPNGVSVIVGMTDAAGKEAVQRFHLDRADRLEEYQPDPAPAALVPRPALVATPGPQAPYKLPEAPPLPDFTSARLTARAEVPVPGKIDAVVPAGSGRFLVLHVKAARKALVFDACAATVTREIDLTDPDAVLAAGATHLLVYRRVDNTIEKYDLMTGTGGGRKAIPTRGVTEMLMGSASAGPVFVRSGLQAELYDAEALIPIDLPRVVPGGADTFPFRQGRVWVSPDGRTFTNVAERPTGPVARMAYLSPYGIEVVSSILPRPPAYILPDDMTQRRLYVGGYGVSTVTTDLQRNPPKLAPIAGEYYGQSGDPVLPARNGVYFLTVHPARLPREPVPNEVPPKNGVSIYRRDHVTRRFAVVEAPEITAETGRGLGLENAIHLFPWSGVLAVVPQAADRLVIYPVNLGPAADIDRPPLRWRLPDVPPAPVIKPTVLREQKTINLGTYNFFRAATGGSRYLVCVRENDWLRIIDVVEGKVVGGIPGSSAFAVGMSKLVVVGGFSPSTLDRYDLATGKREASVPILEHPLGMAMGSASEGPLAVVGRDGITFYDLATLQPLQQPGEAGKWNLDSQHLAASADGRTFVAQRWADEAGTGPVVITLEKDRVRYVTRAGPRFLSSVAASPDGRHVFLDGVGVVGGDLQAVADVAYSPKQLGEKTEPGLTFVPAVDGPYYLHTHLGKRAANPQFAADPEFGVTVYRYGDPKPKGRVPGAFGPLPKRVGKIPWEIERSNPGEVAFLFSSAKVLATVGIDRKSVVLTPLDPEAIPPVVDQPKPKKP